MAKPARSRYIFKQDGRVLIRSTGEHIGNIVSRTQSTGSNSWDQWWEPQRVDGTVCPQAAFAFKDYAADHLRHEVQGKPTPEQSAAQKAKVTDLVTTALTPALLDEAGGDAALLREAVNAYDSYLTGHFLTEFISTDKELRDIAKVVAADDHCVRRIRTYLRQHRRAG